MKKLLLMAAFVLSTVGAFAQYEKGDFTIQPKVGLNVTNITAGDNKTKHNWKAGFVGGVEAEYHFNHLMGLSFGALYSQQGLKGTYEKVDYKWKLDYINIPILANFYVVNGLAVKVGVQPGFAVSKKLNASVSAAGTSGTLQDNRIKTFDFAVPVGISYEYCNICLDARYNIGCSNIFKDSEDYTGRNQVFQLTLGYKFKL